MYPMFVFHLCSCNVLTTDNGELSLHEYEQYVTSVSEFEPPRLICV